eukprot:4919999-Pyramimonas_sp.AAC.1
MKVNVSKTEALFVVCGEGSKKLNKTIQKKQVKFGQGDSSFSATPSVKYVGAQVRGDGRSFEEVSTRISKATAAHARLTLRVWRSTSIATPLKLRLWNSLVRSILLYATEVCVMTVTDEARLERFQTKKLRHLLKSPAHLGRVSNYDIRDRARVFSIQTTLLFRRLCWWRHVLRPVFVERPDHGYDETVGVRAILFGRFAFENDNADGSGVVSDRMASLCRDLRALLPTLPASRQREVYQRTGLHAVGDVVERVWL